MRLLWLLTALLPLLPAAGVTSDGSMWHADSVRPDGYIPLEALRSFYKFMPVPKPAVSGTRAVGNGTVTLVFGPDARDLSIHGIRCRLAYPVKTDDKGDLLISKVDLVSLIDPILRPTYIANRRAVGTVVLDAGHGGHDVGTVCESVREADITLLLANKLAAELRKRQINVVLTRENNVNISPQQRVDKANAVADSIYITLHLNKGRSDVQGAEVYTIAPVKPGEQERPVNKHDAANAALAMALQASLVGKAGVKDGGLRRMQYNYMSSLTCPAAHVEVGYITHAEEGLKLSTEEYQNSVVMALADGIAAFATTMNPQTHLKAIPPPPAPPPQPPEKVEPAKKKATPAKSSTKKTRRPERRSRPVQRNRRRR